MQLQDNRQVFSINEVNTLAKELLEQVNIWVEGEVAEFKSADSRYYYVYFSLKEADGKTTLPAYMLPPTYDGLGFDFANGQKVLAHGKLSLFTKSGKFVFAADRIELAGAGQLARDLEKLKATLQAEGLMAAERKRPLPAVVQKVGVITSTASDAWVDFQRHSVQKFPAMQLLVADVYVQGIKAVPSLLRAISAMQNQDVEVVVITRGGGSADDLAAFNDEQVVRAIAASRIPTLVAVGHEKDVSVADLVADVRASTPTNAGQILTAGYEAAIHQLDKYQLGLQRYGSHTVTRLAESLDYAMRQLAATRHRYQGLPYQLDTLAGALQQQYYRLTQGKLLQLQGLAGRVQSAGMLLASGHQQHLASLSRQLEIVSPLAILQRGYSLVEVNGQIVRSAGQAKQGDTMHIRLHKGGLKGLITKVEE